MLFSQRLDKILYIILKKDKQRRENILKLLNLIPNKMYKEIQSILELYEDESDQCAIKELETNEFIVEKNRIIAKYIVGHELKIESVGDLNILLNLKEKEAAYFDKNSFICYELENDKIIRWNTRKKYIIPIIKTYYASDKDKNLTLKYINNKFNK